MTARLHPGAVRHVWDHFVIGLQSAAGETRLSLYAITWSSTLGSGHVCFLTLPDGTAMAWSDRPGLAERMQARLRAMGTIDPAVDAPVRAARFERVTDDALDSIGFRLAGDEGGLVARLLGVGPPVWVEGPAPAFWAQEDIWACFVESGDALLELNGQVLPGVPWLDDVWIPKLGRALWSAHVALAEVRVDPVA